METLRMVIAEDYELIPSFSFGLGPPSISVQSALVDTSLIGGDAALQFIYAAIKSELPVIESADLRQDRYLAEGSCSQVRSAIYHGQAVAVKRVIERNLVHAEKVERGQRIEEKIGNLRKDLEVCSHPELVKSDHIPKLIGYGSEGGLPFLVMELATTGTLTRLLYKDHDWAMRLSILIQVADGLQDLHANKITHGDLKLENILVFQEYPGHYRAKLADFSHSTYTSPGIANPGSTFYFGTWPLVPIEVWHNEGDVDLYKCDVWTYGILFFRVAHYRNDDIVSNLERIVPKIKNDPDPKTSKGDLQSSWLTVYVTLDEGLKTSPTVVPTERSAVLQIFQGCSEISPIKRFDMIEVLGHFHALQASPTNLTEISLRIAGDMLSATSSTRPPEISSACSSIRSKCYPKEASDGWLAHKKEFSIFSMFNNTSLSWQLKKDFFKELLISKPKEDQPAFKPALVAICKAYGFGCLKDPQPIRDLILAEESRNSTASVNSHGLHDETASIIERLQSEKAILWCFENILTQELSGDSATTELSYKRASESENGEVDKLIRDLVGFLRAFPRGQIRSNMLWAAVKYGFPLVAVAMASFCDVTEGDLEYGSTPLHLLWSLPENSMKFVAKDIVGRGAVVDAHCNANAASYLGFSKGGIVLVGTPLNWAIKAGSLSAVQVLLDLGADPLHECHTCSNTPLLTAVSLFRPDIVKVLLGAVVRIPPIPLEDKQISNVTSSVLRGFAPSLSTEQERSILHGAALGERAIETLDLALAYLEGGVPQFLDLLLLQTVWGSHGEPVSIMPYLTIDLIRRDTDLQPRLGFRITPLIHRLIRLWEAGGENCEALLESILQTFPNHALTDISLTDNGRRTALHEAAIYNACPIIEILARHGADLNAEDEDGCTPLSLACRMDSEAAFDLLLDLEAGITHSRGNVLHDGALPQLPKSIIPYALLESKHREIFADHGALECIHDTVKTTPLGIAVLASDVGAARTFLHCEVNSRAAFVNESWGFTISVRELATMKRYRPYLFPVVQQQRQRGIGPDENIRNIRIIQQILYSGCGDSDFEEPESITLGARGLIMAFQVRKTRPDEWYPMPYVSLDVLPRRPVQIGRSKWEETDVKPEEGIENRYVTLPKSKEERELCAFS